MTNADVSNSVLSIIASFTNGLDVFKKLRERRKKSKGRAQKDDQVAASEIKLSRSLRKGPDDIGREYQRSAKSIVGQHMAIGDTHAQASLAEILLRLNSGIVSIITTFLSRDKHERLDLDYRSLTDLSELSRVQTVGVLRGLYQRALARLAPARLPAPKQGRSTVSAARKNRRPDLASPKRSRIRGPTLARVTIQDSTRPAQLAVVRPSGSRKSSQTKSDMAARDSASSPALAAPGVPRATSQLSLPPSMPPMVREQGRRTGSQSSAAVNLLPFSDRPQDTLFQQAWVRSNNLQPSQSTSRLTPLYEQIYNMPTAAYADTKAPVVSRRQRKETPTFYSTNSVGTKLGEIPMHKWAVPFDYDAASMKNREAMANGWPGVDEAAPKKQRGGVFKLFRRKQKV